MRKELAPLAATAMAMLVAVSGTYSFLRAYEVLFKPPGQNPATIVWQAHIAMFWRLDIGAYVALMAAPLVFMAARHDLPKMLRAVSGAAMVSALLTAVQATFMP